MNRVAYINGNRHEDANSIDRMLGNAIMRVMHHMERDGVQHVDLAVDPTGDRPVSPPGLLLEKACDGLQQHMFDRGIRTIRIEVTP